MSTSLRRASDHRHHFICHEPPLSGPAGRYTITELPLVVSHWRMLELTGNLFEHAGGAIPPIQVYPSGSIFHTSCAAHRLLQVRTDVEFRSQLLRTLTVLASARKHKVRDSARHKCDIEEAQMQLRTLLIEGDCLNTDCVLDLIELPYENPNRPIDLRMKAA
jgi:hypothetical protein